MRNVVGTLASMVLVLGISAAAWSSESDELRAKAKAVQHEAEVLAKEGRKEEAEKLFREVKELLTAADKHEVKSSTSPDREIDELHQQLKAIAEKEQHAEKSKNKDALAELRKHRANIERELAEHREHHGRKPGQKHADKFAPELPEPMQDAARRLKHLHVAIENLHAAGMHDVAEELANKAEHMERELHQAHEKVSKAHSSPEKLKRFDAEHKHPEPKGKFAPGHAPVDELRNELQRLRAELNELREEIKKRP